MNFISNNEGSTGITEYKVAKYMADNHYCARDTTGRLIYEVLIPNGLVIDKKVGNSFHKLFINRRNEFNRLVTEMNRLEEDLYNLNNSAVKMMKAIKGPSTRNFIHLAQLIVYRRITVLVTSIEKYIKSNDDREILYHKLPDILKTSIKLNEIIFPEVFKQVVHIRKKWRADKEGTLYPNFITEVVGIFKDSDLK